MAGLPLRAEYALVIIGAGPAGMAAAIRACDLGVSSILLIDREPEPGGILNQCIHNGFGLHWFKEELTGPEYAERFAEQLAKRSITLLTDAFVMEVDSNRRVAVLSAKTGLVVVSAAAVILAMGARERTRGAIRIPGDRPSGVLNAGLAQKFVNQLGVLPGRRAVILGSGDIGLIMARRLTLEQVEVEGVYEIMPHANGLNRNIVQCLHDFGIPLHLSTTVVQIHGRDRLEGVTVAPVGPDRVPQLVHARYIACDTLLLSVGLIPENELSRQMGVALDPVTQGPVVDSRMQTSLAGVFACGNVVHIHDLVDFVSAEGTLAGESAARFIQGESVAPDAIRLRPGAHVRYCVPHSLSPGRTQTVYLRVDQPLQRARLKIGPNEAKVLRYAFPAEMISVRVIPPALEAVPTSLAGTTTVDRTASQVIWDVEVHADE